MNWLFVLADQGDRAAKAAASVIRDVTFLDPVAAIVLVFCCLYATLASRRTAILSLLVMMCFVPSAQRVVVAGADFSLLRITGIALASRIAIRSEYGGVLWNRVDVSFLLWGVIGGLLYVIQRADFSAAVYIAGFWLDVFLPYLAVRCLVRQKSDYLQIAQWLALIVIVSAALFSVESVSRRNLFAVMGGVPEVTVVREGRLRCQGPYSHPILAGVFWATLVPVLIGEALAARRGGKGKILLWLGVLGACVIVVASASSTPVLGLVVAAAFWLLWPLRAWMKLAILVSPIILLALHLIMEAPVWHLVSRMSAVGGSTGYHRFVLIDEAIRHMSEWWLVGTPSTVHWSEYFQTWDITNHYILQGVRGGVVRLLLFWALIVFSCLQLERVFKTTASRADQFVIWGLGGAMAASLACFIGVSYFGQIEYLWHILIALCAGSGCLGVTMEQDLQARHRKCKLA